MPRREIRRIPIADRVIGEDERRHQNRGLKGDDDEIGFEQPGERNAPGLLPVSQMPLPLLPHRTLFHARHDPEHEQRRQHADPHHHSPAVLGALTDERVGELIHERRQHESDRVARLQHPGRDPAQVRRPVLERQRHAGRPHAAHADSEERAEQEQHPIRRREPAEERKQRVPQDGKHQRTLAAPPIRGRAGADAADDAEEQRDGRERAERRLVHAERALNIDEQKAEDRVVESVEHPPKERGKKRLPLISGDLPVPGASGWSDGLGRR